MSVNVSPMDAPHQPLSPNDDMIKRYFDVVFGYTEGLMPLRPITENGNPQLLTPQWLPSTCDGIKACIKFAGECTQRKAAFYVIPGTVRRAGQAKADHIYQMQSVMVDLDFGDIDAKAKHLIRYLGTPTLVVESGGITPEGQKKKHIYFQLQEAYHESEDLRRIKRLREVMALKAGGDEHFKSLHQPIRVAGSIYHKGGALKLVTIIENNIHEHDVKELLEAAEDMPSFDLKSQSRSAHHQKNRKGAKLTIDEIMVTRFREGDVDELSRYQALSKIIGYWIRRFHEGRSSLKEAWREIKGFNQALIVAPWAVQRLMKETRALWAKHTSKYGPPKAPKTPPSPPVLVSYSARVMLEAPAPIPTDLIGPRVLTPGGFWLIAGPPKIGKSDFVLNLLTHAAAGVNFLWFGFPKPLRVFYAQAEIEKPYLDERYRFILGRNRSALEKGLDQLYMTSRFSFTFNEDGIEALINHIASRFPDPNSPVDIIAIDPFRNIYQSGLSGGDLNEDLMAFFRERLEGVLQRLNPKAAIILIHHTNKITSKMLLEDPMAAISGGGALLSYPTAISVLGHATDDDNGPLCLWTDLRNGPSIGARQLTKRDGVWCEIEQHDMRLVREHWGEQNDREQVRKRLKILEFIYNEALEGRVYTAASLANTLSQRYKLGSHHTIRKHITSYETKGFIRRFDNEAALRYGLVRTRHPVGYVCVEGMGRAEYADPKTGEIRPSIAYLPTHYRHRSDTLLPLSAEEIHTWVYDHSDDGEV